MKTLRAVIPSCLAALLLLTACSAETAPQSTEQQPSQNQANTEQAAAAEQVTAPQVTIKTSKGTIVLELNPARAPATVKNFLQYVDSGFYNGTVFHRVINGFMIQGGGFDDTMKQKSTLDPIANESDNGLSNARGTIAMARTSIPDSATSQFFINLVDNDFLNGRPNQPGYAVFGRVISGMEVVDAIAGVKTGPRNGHRDVPQENVVINSLTVTGKPAQ